MSWFLTKRRAALTAALAALCCVLFADAALGQQSPPAATVLAESKFEADNLPARLRLVQVVADFAPGDTTQWQTPPGPGFVTVIDGAVTVRGDGTERTYQADESYLEEPGQLLAVSGAAPSGARLLTTFLLPQAAPPTAAEGAAGPQELPPGATTVARADFELADQPPELNVVQRVVDFAPGAVVPAHIHLGPSFVTLLAGEVALCIGGVRQRFTAGDTWVEPADTPHSGVNGAEPARIAATTLLPKGAPLLTLVGRCTDASHAQGGPRHAALAVAP